MSRRHLALVVALLALAVACGDKGSTQAANTAAQPGSAPPGSQAPGGTTGPAGTTAGTTPAARPVPKPETQKAGPVSVSAQICEVTGVEFKGGTEAVTSLAFTSDHAFVASDKKVWALDMKADAAGCKMRLDTKMGKNGELDVGTDPISSVSATPKGRVVVSGVLGTRVFDTATGASYACKDVTGNVIVHPSGTYAYRWFPGSPVKRVDLGETKCTPGADVPMPFADVVFLAFDGDNILVGGKDAAGVMTAARSADATVQWDHGNAQVSKEDALGWVHGMAECGEGYCLADTNFDRFQVLSAAGEHRASFTISKLLGLPKGFTKTMVVGPDNSPYLLNAVTTGGSTFGYIARVQATG